MTLRSRRILSLATLALAALAYRSALGSRAHESLLPPLEGWFFLPLDTPAHVVLLLSAALLYRNWREIRTAARGRGSVGLAIVPLLTSFALYTWGHLTQAPDIMLLSLIAAGIGACLLIAGRTLAARMLLPLALMLFAIPLPAVLTNELYSQLQNQIAPHVASILPLFGFPVFQEGNAVYSAFESFEVIDTCSGLRFIEILLLLAVFYAGWFGARGLRTALLIGLAPLIAYFFNLLRVCLLIIYPTAGASMTHSVQGWAVFLSAVVTLAYFDRGILLLSKLRAPPRVAPPEPKSATGPFVIGGARLSVLALLFSAMLFVSTAVPQWQPPSEGRFEPIDLPVTVNDWRLNRHLLPDEIFLGAVRFSTYVSRPYSRNGELIFLFLAYDDRINRGRSMISPKNAFPDGAWSVEKRSLIELAPGGPPVESVLIRSRDRLMLSFNWYENRGSLLYEVARAFLALDQSPFRRNTPARVTRISTAVDVQHGGEAAAEARLRAFAPAFESARAQKARRAAKPNAER